MNFRLTAILFGLLLVGTLVLLTLSFLDETPTVGDIVFEELAKASVKAKDIDTIEIERTDPAGKIVLVRVGKDGWELREPVNAKADSTAIESLANALLGAKPLASPETQNPLASLGLQPPSLRVTLKKGSDQAATLNLGKVTLGDQQAVVFASTAAHPDRAMAIRRSSLESLFTEAARKSAGEPASTFAKNVSDWRNLRPLGGAPSIPHPPVAALTLTSKNKSLSLAKNKDAWTITEPSLGAADTAGDSAPTPGKFTGVSPMIAAIVQLGAATPKDFIESPRDLKEFGLNADNPDLVKVEVKTAEGKATTLLIGKKIEKEPGKVYVQVQGDSGVFKASSPNIEGLAAVIADPASLRDRNLLDLDRARIDALDITVSGQTAKLRRGAKGWSLHGSPRDPQATAALPVENLLALLAERRTIRDFSPANDANFAPGEVKAEVKVFADAIDPKADPAKEPDLKDKKPTVLTFGKVEGDAIHVRRMKPDGAKADFLLPAKVLVGPGKAEVKLLDTVVKTRLDLLEPRLKSFSTALANRLTFTRSDGETVEVGKMSVLDPQYPNGRWEFVQPASRKGQPANTGEIDQLLQLLATATVSRFVAEEPTSQQLAEWGLDPKSPKLKVMVQLETTDDKERGYLFGSETPDKESVYGQQLGQPEVFLVSRATVARFSGSAELRDRTLVAFDRSRLKGLTVRGWRTADKPLTTLELTRANNTWTAKAPASFPVDPVKVDRLVDALFVARVASFLGPLKDEYGFGVDTQNALEITLELEGLPSLVVNIGALTDGGKSYNVFCNQRPGEAVTVAAEALKPFKEKPESLAK